MNLSGQKMRLYFWSSKYFFQWFRKEQWHLKVTWNPAALIKSVQKDKSLISCAKRWKKCLRRSNIPVQTLQTLVMRPKKDNWLFPRFINQSKIRTTSFNVCTAARVSLSCFSRGHTRRPRRPRAVLPASVASQETSNCPVKSPSKYTSPCFIETETIYGH